jgi:phosphatidylserine decarboxylase
MQYHPGEFLNAMDLESGARNENLLMGFESSEKPGEKIGIRLIAGLIARRIVPWIQVGDSVKRGDRISLIRFGSRCDIYLPLDAKIQINIGDKVVGGETILAYRS